MVAPNVHPKEAPFSVMGTGYGGILPGLSTLDLYHRDWRRAVGETEWL
jgi:hypothetical protein